MASDPPELLSLPPELLENILKYALPSCIFIRYSRTRPHQPVRFKAKSNIPLVCRQPHAEFHSTLRRHALAQARNLVFKTTDLNFRPLQRYLTSLSPADRSALLTEQRANLVIRLGFCTHFRYLASVNLKRTDGFTNWLEFRNADIDPFPVRYELDSTRHHYPPHIETFLDRLRDDFPSPQHPDNRRVLEVIWSYVLKFRASNPDGILPLGVAPRTDTTDVGGTSESSESEDGGAERKRLRDLNPQDKRVEGERQIEEKMARNAVSAARWERRRRMAVALERRRRRVKELPIG